MDFGGIHTYASFSTGVEFLILFYSSRKELSIAFADLIVYVDSDTIIYEEAARILLDILAQFDKANIPFRTIDFVLETYLPEEGPLTEDDIRIEDFRYEDMIEEGLANRISEAHAELTAYYAELDDKQPSSKSVLIFVIPMSYSDTILITMKGSGSREPLPFVSVDILFYLSSFQTKAPLLLGTAGLLSYP